MSGLGVTQVLTEDINASQCAKRRVASRGNSPEVLADIYEQDVNIAVWQRSLSESLQNAVDGFLTASTDVSVSRVVTSNSVLTDVSEALGRFGTSELVQDIAELVDMFCYLFELNSAGLRLATLNRAMCPRFHVDRVPCRLVTTYQGVTTEWLSHDAVDRSKLGHGSGGRLDHESGLYQRSSDIQRLTHGDVALLKGESWIGNEDAGLVHRSPQVPAEERRLLLTLDVGR